MNTHHFLNEEIYITLDILEISEWDCIEQSLVAGKTLQKTKIQETI